MRLGRTEEAGRRKIDVLESFLHSSSRQTRSRDKQAKRRKEKEIVLGCLVAEITRLWGSQERK